MASKAITSNPVIKDLLISKVLIIDDDQDVLNAIAAALTLDDHFVVKIATNSESAIKSLDSFQPDFVLIDVNLGTSNGLDLIPVLKQRLPNIRCLIMTAYRDVEYAMSALRCGADEFLLKPIDPEKLSGTLTAIKDREQINTKSVHPMNVFLEESYALKFLLDSEGCLVDATKNTLEFTAVELNELLGIQFHKTPWFSHSLLIQEEFKDAIKKAKNGVTSRLEASMIDAEKNSLWYEFRVRPLLDVNENKIITVEGNDITKHKITEQKLTLLAHSDPLTGLSNRVSLEAQLRQIIAHSSRNKTNFAVMFIDIDDFKIYNDRFGHQAGDEILIKISEHIKSCAREEDIVARIGGDEFVIVLASAKLKTDALIIAKRINTMVSDLQQNGEELIGVSTSIGLSFYPGDGEDARALLDNADKAMYAAKKSGKNKYISTSEADVKQRETMKMNNIKTNHIKSERSNVRILIVDDDNDILESLKSVLQLTDYTYKIKTAESVNKAITVSSEFKPDIAILDIKLGNDNGLELIPLLKNENEELVCIMMTAFRDADYAVTAVRFGANDYLYKPIEPRKFITTIERAVENINLKRDKEESDRRFRAVFQQSFQWLILLNSNGDIIEVNEETLEFSSMDLSAVIGNKIWDAPWWGSSPSLKSRIRSITKQVQNGKFVREEVGIKNQDGGNVTLDLSMKPIQSMGKEIIQIIVECRDVTERKNTENLLVEAREFLEETILERTIELQNEKKKAEEASEDKSKLLSRMSHELRTPLNAVLGFSQLLSMESKELNEDQKEAVDNIILGGKNLLNMVNEVLDISEVESGKLNLHVTEISIKESLKSVASLYTPFSKQKGIIVNECMSDDAYVMADQNRFNQVILNFIQNAIKFNKINGSVNVTIEEINPGFKRINIIDTGIGILPEDQKQLFDPFVKVGGSASNSDGVGLGLSISKKLVDLMGGKTGFTSEYGKGSTFWFELPAVLTAKK